MASDTLVMKQQQAIAEPRQATPVKWWAFGGCLVLGLTAYSWGRWLLGGHAHPTRTGADAVPLHMVIASRAQEAIFTLLAVVIVYHVIIKPWRRGERLSLDGMILIALVTMWAFQDPLSNYTQVWWTYNSELLNLGCPQCFLPGWQSNMSAFPESIVWGPMFYLAIGWLVLRWFDSWMHAIRRRWPQTGNVGVFGAILAFAVVFDLVVEVGWLAMGTYIIPGAQREISLFPNHYFKFPLWEALFGGLWWVVIAAFRHYRNDRGETWAERGIDRISVSARQRTGLRLLAVIGVMNALQFVGYTVPVYWLGILQAGGWPKDVVERSYFTNQVCGPGTTFACPDDARRVPISRGPNSARATPDGQLIAPKGLPVQP